MGGLELLRRGAKYALRGDVSRIVDFVNETAKDEFRRRSAVDATLSVRRDDPPGWLRTAGDVETIRYPSRSRESGNTSRYFCVLPPETAGSVRTDEPIHGVDLSLTNVSNAKTATAVAVTENGERLAKSLSNHSSFECGVSYPVSFEFDEPTTEVEISVEQTVDSGAVWRARLLDFVTDEEFTPARRVRVGRPTPRSTVEKVPILLISLDSVRYDHRDRLEPLVDALGDDAVVPDEPRTQGFWTPPSHASLFTGVHPGDHRYVGWTEEQNVPIHPGLTTLGELLAENLYKCSGLVSHTRILPEFGFDRGFHRYRLNDMRNWVTREHDARTNVNQVLEWMRRDAVASEDGLFYFLHLFDPHLPYVPPLPDAEIDDLDLAAVARYREQAHETTDYLELLDRESRVDDDLVETVRRYYERSIEFTAEQVVRLVDFLKARGRFDDFFVVVTADHGEEFGERGFYDHLSLYDENVRPFVVVKPPADAEWDVPDRVDLLDVLPTVAELLGETPPDQCQGRAWQRDRPSDGPRITERISPDWYNVSVEIGDRKCVLTYEANYPERPTRSQLDAGPRREEFYRLSDVRQGTYDDVGARLSADEKDQFRAVAEAFVSAPRITDETDERALRPTQETDEQLEHLGYK